MRRKPKYLYETPEDKQLRMVLISLISSIFLCMVCLVGTTWAWFQTSITSAGSVIRIGQMEVAVTLMRGDQADREKIDPSGQYTYELDEIGTYSITLINSGSLPGFCTVTLTDDLGNVESFSTGTLHPAGDGLEDSATIELTVTPQDSYNEILPVTLEITPYWGEDPAYTIADIDEEVFVPTEESTESTYPAADSEEQEDQTDAATSSEGVDETQDTGSDQLETLETTTQTEPSISESTGQPDASESESGEEQTGEEDDDPTVPSTTAATTALEEQSETADPTEDDSFTENQ